VIKEAAPQSSRCIVAWSWPKRSCLAFSRGTGCVRDDDHCAAREHSSESKIDYGSTVKQNQESRGDSNSMHILSVFAALMSEITMRVVVGTILESAFVYAIIFLPKAETGFYSWHPIKRILAIILFPFVLIYALASSTSDEDAEYITFF
jgi:hypothetical protein